jgi:ABC-type glycerol-3-phosphate transport system substrate-binding protein
VDSVWVAGLARSGFLYALEDLKAQVNHSSFVQDLYPTVVGANTFDGKLYALPGTVDASLLWYRKDWFAQEGLAPPRDWDELVRVALHFLQPRTQQRYGLIRPLAFPAGISGGEATVYALLPFVWSAGGDVCDSKTIVLDRPGTRQALSFLRELVSVHGVASPEVVTYRSNTVPQLFARGKVAMALGGSYEAANLREWSGWRGQEFSDKVGCVLTPAAPGATPVATLGGISYVVLRQCQRPKLMLELLQVASNAQVVGNVYRSMLLASASPIFNAALPSGGELPLDRVVQMVAFGRARPSMPDYVRVSRQLQAMFEAAISTSTPVEDIVRRTAEFISVISECPSELA